MASIPEYTLNDGTTLPAIGLGTYSLNGSAGADAIAEAIGLGYRLLDTALGYGNEDAVGEGIRRSGVDRGRIVVTSKIPDRFHGSAEARDALARTLDNLRLDRVDLYLIHWPVPAQDRYLETWETMIELRREGLVRSIGVSNFDAVQLDRVIEATGVTPTVNQVPVHVFEQQPALRADDSERGVLTESYSPLKHGDRLRREPVLVDIARRHGVTPGQVALRWNVQLGALPIPRSRAPEHQRENLDVFGFALSEEEMRLVGGIR